MKLKCEYYPAMIVYDFKCVLRQSKACVWIFQSELKPTKFVRSRSVAKLMIACFIGFTEHVATVTLENRGNVRSCLLYHNLFVASHR